MIKTSISIIGLILANLAPSPAVPPVLPTEVGISIPQAELIKPIDPESVKLSTVQPLSYAGYHFDPMGSHPNSYAPANCTWGASSMEPQIPQSWGNANNWANAARESGYTVSDVPIVGAIAQTSRGAFGHVAIVTEVHGDTIQIEEMNYDDAGGVRSRPANVSEFTYIYL